MALNSKIKTALWVLIIILTGHLSLSAQARYLSLQDYTVDDVSIVGFSRYSIKAHLQIQNDTSAFAISNILLEIFKEENLFATGQVNDVFLENNSNCIYIKGVFTIIGSVPILNILGIITHKESLSKLFVEANMKITFPSGDIKQVCKRRIDVGPLLNIRPKCRL